MPDRARRRRVDAASRARHLRRFRIIYAEWGQIANGTWLLAITIGLAIAFKGIADRTTEIQDGRAQGSRVTCAIANALASSGRQVLTAQVGKPETRFERRLERLGYPPKAARDAGAKAQAHEYAANIARKVAAVRPGAEQIIRKDGTLDCRRFLIVTKATR